MYRRGKPCWSLVRLPSSEGTILLARIILSPLSLSLSRLCLLEPSILKVSSNKLWVLLLYALKFRSIFYLCTRLVLTRSSWLVWFSLSVSVLGWFRQGVWRTEMAALEKKGHAPFTKTVKPSNAPARHKRSKRLDIWDCFGRFCQFYIVSAVFLRIFCFCKMAVILRKKILRLRRVLLRKLLINLSW